MRNLKKILALVLALVMSLSLMATAGAASFQDVKDDNPYKTAIDVLDELKVFQGFEDGTFKPDDTLTRAQAAVLVYRIATGDVEGKYVANYTEMTNSQFTDLAGYNWAKGYINYCQNAKYVIGTSATTFDPGAKVTGYQLLVMLLRVLGYGQAGEFSNGRTWELETAKIAEREGILQNVTTGDLGAAAPRQMVAEILFQGLLTKTVQYSVMTPDGYTKGETLGKREFGLEGYEAVVVANEFANLNDTQVLPEGKTDVQVEGEDDVRTLTYGTKITDIGERRLIYTQNGSKVLFLADSVDGEKLNTVKEYGEGVDISTTAKFKAAAEMPAAAGIEYYVNFEPDGYWTSDYRIEYTITFASDFDGAKDAATYNRNAGFTSGTATTWAADNRTLNRVIPAGQPITLTDYNNMWSIFTYSNGLTDGEDKTTPDNDIGKVFVMTQTKEDISDKISFKAFVKDYLNPIDNTRNWDESNNGQWVKFIDNDGDGECEYAFKTHYWLDEAISSYKNKAGDTVLQYRGGFDDDDHSKLTNDYTVRYMEDDEAIERDVVVGDIVLVAQIDNQALVSKAQSVTTSANSYNYKDDEIKAADGETYGQSGIGVNTDMQIYIANMAPNTEYEMFLDKFGFVRAYRQPGGTKYALVTELYYTNDQYGNIQQNWPMTVELTMPDEDGNPVTKEYPVASGGAAQLTAKAPWSLVSSKASTGNYYNWLQPAIAHLGVTRNDYKAVNGAPTFVTIDPLYSTYWPSALQLVRNIQTWGTLNEFNYGAQNYRQVTGTAGADPTWTVAQTDTSSFTNIAIVNGDDTVTLTGAAKLNLQSTGGIDPVHPYAVDYIQLSKDTPVKGAASYAIDDGNVSDTYEENNNWYVNADKNTEFYIVYDKGVKYFTGYANMPKMADYVGNVHAAYAVARNTTTGTSTKNYWMADVIVYEVDTWNDAAEKGSISLAYFTASQQLQSASSVTVNTLNSKATPAKVDLTPAGLSWGTSNNWWDNWGTSWQGYGFYQLYDEKLPAEGETVMTAKSIKAIDEKFADYGIYAGTVTQEVETAIKGGYIPVNIDRNDTVTVNGTPGVLATNIRLSISDTKVYSITGAVRSNPTDYRYYAEADNLVYNNVRWSDVKAGDRIIWVGECKDGLAVSGSSFIVDLGNPVETPDQPLLNNKELYDATPWWLGGGNTVGQGLTPVIAVDGDNLWDAVLDEQEAEPTPYTITAVATDGTNPIPGVTFTITPDEFDSDDMKTGITNVTIEPSAPYAIADVADAVKITNNAEKKAGENATVVKNDDGSYSFYQIEGSIELSVKVEVVNYELTADLTDSGLSDVKLAYGDPATTEDTWNGTTAVTMTKGTEYTITFTPDEGASYTVDGEDATLNADGDVEITGTLDDDTEVVIVKVVYTLTVTLGANVTSVNVTVGEGAPETVTATKDIEDINKGSAVTFSNIVYADGYGAGQTAPNITNMTENTTVEFTATELSDETEPTAVTVNGEDATLAVDTYAVSDLPYGADDATVAITLPTGAEIKSVWKGQVNFGDPVSVTTDNTYTMSVGANGAATTYSIVIAAENGDEATYKITLEAAVASDDATVTPADGSGITVEGTSGATGTITLPAGTKTTAGRLVTLLVPAEGAEVAVTKANGDATTEADEIAAGMKVVVTAQDGTTETTYTIAIAT